MKQGGRQGPPRTYREVRAPRNSARHLDRDRQGKKGQKPQNNDLITTRRKREKNGKKDEKLLSLTYRPKGPKEREKMTKTVFNMLFLFVALLVSWNLQDNGQHTAGALLLLVSLVLAFVLQIEKGTK
jgi:hypothetical protein